MTDLLHQMHHDLRRLARENERLREEVANAATAERARLAGMASEEDRKMVEAFGLAVFAVAVATERRNFDMAIAEKSGAAKVTLLARLAAARGEAVEEAIRWAWANHERFHVDSEDEVVRDALAALFPPPGAEVGRG